MPRIDPYREETQKVFQISLEKLDEMIHEKQNETTNNLPKSVNPELITKEFEMDSVRVKNILDVVCRKSMMGINLPDIGFDIIRSSLLLYKDDLMTASELSSTKELQAEINEVNRILELPFIKDAEESFYEKYQKIKSEISLKISTDELIEILERINVISKQKLKTRLFKNNAKSIKELNYKCEDESQFIYKIAIVANLIGEIHKDEIKKIISLEGVTGSINILEKLFSEKDENYDKKSFEILRKLTKLRSTKMPIHSGEHEAIGIIEELEISHPIDYRIAGEKIDKKYVEAMKGILDIIEKW